jgi:Putative bacterial sensory transduction regulator
MFTELTLEVIVAAAKTCGWEYSAKDGHVQLYIDGPACELVFMVDKRGEDLLCVDAFSLQSEGDAAGRDFLLRWCNEWNGTHLFPKMYVITDDHGSSSLVGQYCARVTQPFEFSTVIKHLRWAVDTANQAWLDYKQAH